jgi:hypothetical protein
VESATRACRSRAGARSRGGGARAGPAPRLGDAVVHRRQLGVEHRVVVAQLEELRVGELEDVLHVGVVGARLDDERVVPREEREVVGVVAEAVRQELAARVGRQRARLGEEERHHGGVVELRRGGGRAGRVAQRVDAEHHVVLALRREHRALDRRRDALGEQAQVVANTGVRSVPTSTVVPKRTNSSHVPPAGASMRTRSETTPKSKMRAETSASRGAPKPARATRSWPRITVSGGLAICSACASPRTGRTRAGALAASRSRARSRRMS